MDSYVKIENDKVIAVYGSSWKLNNTNLERRQGAKLIKIPVSELQKVTYVKALESRANSYHNFIVEDGKARLKNDEEILEERRPDIKRELKSKRDAELNAITVEVNGKVFQSRKSDEMNFRLVLGTMADGDTEEWILEDDSVVEVTKAEIQEAYLKGLAEGKRIFAEYKEALKAL